jgi:hypothetical protein
MRHQTSSFPFITWILIILLFFLGLGGLVSGALLFSAPDGSLIGMPKTYLEGSPFPDFLVPGIILFLFVGVYQVFVGYGLLKRPAWQWPEKINPLRRYHWAWTASWAAGVILLIWIAVETVLLGYISLLQPIILVWGIVLIVLTLLPATRRCYERSR